MEDIKMLESKLKAQGLRLTKVRRALIALFTREHTPLSVVEIKSLLAEKKLKPNKSTIYRELEFLMKHGVVVEIQFAEDKKRYEGAFGNHHHHLICIKCETIEDVVLQQELHKEEERIAQSKQFKVLNHSLEFFGICAHCQ